MWWQQNRSWCGLELELSQVVVQDSNRHLPPRRLETAGSVACSAYTHRSWWWGCSVSSASGRRCSGNSMAGWLVPAGVVGWSAGWHARWSVGAGSSVLLVGLLASQSVLAGRSVGAGSLVGTGWRSVLGSGWVAGRCWSVLAGWLAAG